MVWVERTWPDRVVVRRAVGRLRPCAAPSGWRSRAAPVAKAQIREQIAEGISVEKIQAILDKCMEDTRLHELRVHEPELPEVAEAPGVRR
jgi:hypothetical protein